MFWTVEECNGDWCRCRLLEVESGCWLERQVTNECVTLAKLRSIDVESDNAATVLLLLMC